jgi:hypothetical protein
MQSPNTGQCGDGSHHDQVREALPLASRGRLAHCAGDAGPAAHAELGQDRRHVVADGSRRDDEALRDLDVRRSG